MKVNFYKLPLHSTICMSAGSVFKQDKLAQGIVKSKVIKVFVMPHSKTSLDIEMASGDTSVDDSFVVALHKDGFKFLHCDETYSYLAGCIPERYYFKVTKKQGLNELVAYLKNVLYELVGDCIESDDFTMLIRFFRTEQMSIDIANDIPYIKY